MHLNSTLLPMEKNILCTRRDDCVMPNDLTRDERDLNTERIPTKDLSHPFTATVGNDNNIANNNNNAVRIPVEELGMTKSVSRSTSVTKMVSKTLSNVKFTTDNIASLIKNPVTIKALEESNESKLIQLLRSNENDCISGEDALVAALADLMNVQQKLLTVENELKQVRNHNDDPFLVPMDDVDRESSINPPLDDTVAVQKELAELRAANEELVAKNYKLTTNLRKKREEISTCTSQLKAVTEKIDVLQYEKGNLLQGIQKLTTGRDELKTKLLCKNEISREQRLLVERLEKRNKSTQAVRAKELQLLELYRQLSIHTGYFKWGKQIRVLEAELSEQQQLFNNNDDTSESY